jgi:hypothetical protein
MNDRDLKQLQKLVEMQGRDGNWNYSEYMWGMFNGMEFALSIIEKREPKFRNQPKTWKK